MALQLSRRIRIIALMCYGFMSMLMLRGVPSFSMQGTGGVEGMGDALNFSNTVKGNIYAAWGWGYTFTQMPGNSFRIITLMCSRVRKHISPHVDPTDPCPC